MVYLCNKILYGELIYGEKILELLSLDNVCFLFGICVVEMMSY